jgi:ribonuclease Z
MVQIIGQVAEEHGDERIAHVMSDIQRYHTDPTEAARLANDANVRLLVFTHFTPPLPSDSLNAIFFRGVNAIRPHGWIAGHDGTLVTLPANSTDVRVSSVSQ